MQTLPIFQVLDELKQHLADNNRLILQAPPGAGKTTQVPLALLNAPWLAGKQIIMLEPRRLATRSVAKRMAQLLGETVGETIGYQIRQEKCFSPKTRILIVTEGILTRKLQADPALENIALVIFDEFHERSIHADLALAMCLQSQELLSEQLKLLIMSATLDSTALSRMLNTEEQEVPVISSAGRCFSVTLNYSPGAIERWHLISAITQKVLLAIEQNQGNILIFLPGVGEIKQLEKALRSLKLNYQEKILINPLYGELSKVQQDQAISAPPAGYRKIVLATNIAETSLTIEGITIVIDSGLQRESYFNPASAMNALHTSRIARDSAQQRSGRAGRLSKGICYRLWTEQQHQQLAKYQKAEILRADLAPLMLELAQWGVSEISDLCWLDLPSRGTIAQAQQLLQALEAIDSSAKITRHGQNMLNLGCHPRLAHMMLKAKTLNFAYTACLLAALLTEKDFLKQLNDNSKPSDIAYRLSLLQELQNKQKLKQSNIDLAQCRRVLQSARQFLQRLNKTTQQRSSKPSLLTIEADMSGLLLAFAYPDRIAKRRKQQALRYVLSNNKGAFFAQQDTLAQQDFIVIAQLNAQKNQEARIFLAASVEQSQLEYYFTAQINEQTTTTWNSKQQRVESITKVQLAHLILTEKKNHQIKKEQLHHNLAIGIRQLGLSCLNWSKQAMHLKQRIQFLQKQQKTCAALFSNIALPDFSDEYLLHHLEDWLMPHLDRQNSIKQLQTLDLYSILNNIIDYRSHQQINKLAPEKISVPSGSVISIDYSNADRPVLAVRLQELFGLQQTPAIVSGQVPLLLHLLSPASRPMQVTCDLASFWENTYNEVKKELRGKYKKHFWPDNPLQAQATSRVKPRK